MTKLRIETLTPEAFAPFGRVYDRPPHIADAQGDAWQWWGEMVPLAGGDRPYTLGRVDIDTPSSRFDWAERHMLSDELLVPLGGDCLVYVGPPEYPGEPGRLPPLDRFRVFRVRSGQGVLLGAGVWHGAPLAERIPLSVLVILLAHTGQQDLHVARFDAVEIVE